MVIDYTITPLSLYRLINRLFDISAPKIANIEKVWNPDDGAPVCTVAGKFQSRGWTEWTQGFQFGSALLQFDATDDREFLEIGRKNTVTRMANHVSHVGVHDHGFNNISTYGNLWRLMREGRIEHNERENDFYELALKVSGAVQAVRWKKLIPSKGYIYSFNGPHSLFIDTMRTLRSLAVAHQLGHVLMGEGDKKISLLSRLLSHAQTTAEFSIYYGAKRDAYDVAGRTAHEILFNTNDGNYRCPSTQQGYSPFSTWSRGLAWAILGFAEQLEFLATLRGVGIPSPEGPVVPRELREQAQAAKAGVTASLVPREEFFKLFEWLHDITPFTENFERAALATAELYIAESCQDGIPMWDFGAPNLHRLTDYKLLPANPFNPWEPVDSSAAAIAAQGLIRLSNYLASQNRPDPKFHAAGLTIAKTLFAAPYLSEKPEHQGLLLHSIYHRPNGWDFVHSGQTVPNGESSMWGDYHLRELALLIMREADGKKLFFFKHD